MKDQHRRWMSVVTLASMLISPVATFADEQKADTETPIRHVIVLIGEDRSFDHTFATYVARPVLRTHRAGFTQGRTVVVPSPASTPTSDPSVRAMNVGATASSYVPGVIPAPHNKSGTC